MAQNKKPRKKRRIVWTPADDKSEFVHPHLQKKEGELLIHTKFKK